IPGENRYFYLMTHVSGMPREWVQSVTFLNWLMTSQPQVDPVGDIPSEQVKVLALQFCEEYGFVNALTFSSAVEKWMRGEGDPGLLGRLRSAITSSRYANAHRAQSSPFARYKSVP